MGQKINPIAFRLGVNRGWDSVWFAKKKEFGKFLIEDFKIRKYIQKKVLILKKSNLTSLKLLKTTK
jgi:small subunit ribosomal protein S3